MASAKDYCAHRTSQCGGVEGGRKQIHRTLSILLFPRQRVNYEVELSVTVTVTEIRLADVPFTQHLTEDPNGIVLPFVTKKFDLNHKEEGITWILSLF